MGSFRQEILFFRSQGVILESRPSFLARKLFRKITTINDYLHFSVFNFLNQCTRVKTEEIRKGRILAVFRAIWRVFLGILPLQKSKAKQKKQRKTKKNVVLFIFP